MAPRLSRRWIAWLKRAVPLLAALTVNACIVYFSTGPTPVSGATIVFVATDDHGRFVDSVRVVIVDVTGGWRVSGATEADGSFRCGLRPDVRRVRAEVLPPDGYVLAKADNWPRDLDVPNGGDLRVEIHVTSRRP